jgi:hypothetical protein
MVVLAGRPITGLLVLLATLPLPLANIPFNEQWSTIAAMNGPVWLSWGLGSWASLCGLLLVLRKLGFRLQRQREVFEREQVSQACEVR